MKLSEMAHAVQMGATLESVIPEGSDPATWRKMIANFLTGKKSKKRTGNGHRNSRRTNYAAQVCARGVAMAELVGRVNEKPATRLVVDDETIPWQGEPIELSETMGEYWL